MAADTETAAPAGLDELETWQVTRSAGDRARRLWRAAWPKLLAAAIAAAAWQLIHLTGWKHYALPGPSAVFADLWAQLPAAFSAADRSIRQRRGMLDPATR